MLSGGLSFECRVALATGATFGGEHFLFLSLLLLEFLHSSFFWSFSIHFNRFQQVLKSVKY